MKKGFTLIELLVVIGIIGILSALLLSAIMGDETDESDKQQDPCARYANYPISRVPVSCLKYFGVNSIRN